MVEPINATLNFYQPPSRLDEDPSVFLDPVKGPTWPLEEFQVSLHDLRPQLRAEVPVLEQLKVQGFAVLTHKATSMGSLADAEAWNKAYLEEICTNVKLMTGADEIFVWNSVQRSSDPGVTTRYEPEKGHFQAAPIEGLQFSATIRPTAAAVHVDQDSENTRRMCKAAVGEDLFERFSRVQQLNHWRPITGPVTRSPLAVLDGRTLKTECTGLHYGMFGPRVVVHHDPEQRWGYISRQCPDEVVLIKIYDTQFDAGDSLYAGHSGCDIHGQDGKEAPRESIEVRLIVCYK